MILIDREAKLAGIVTRGDVLRALDEDPAGAMSVLDAGNRKLIVTYPDEGLHEAAAQMLRNNISRLPVVDRDDPGHVVG
jgi:CIC family chloride channel protein